MYDFRAFVFIGVAVITATFFTSGVQAGGTSYLLGTDSTRINYLSLDGTGANRQVINLDVYNPESTDTTTLSARVIKHLAQTDTQYSHATGMVTYAHGYSSYAMGVGFDLGHTYLLGVDLMVDDTVTLRVLGYWGVPLYFGTSTAGYIDLLPSGYSGRADILYGKGKLKYGYEAGFKTGADVLHQLKFSLAL